MSEFEARTITITRAHMCCVLCVTACTHTTARSTIGPNVDKLGQNMTIVYFITVFVSE